MNSQIKYVDVVLPLPLKGTFTYSLRTGDEVEIGQRVVVQFGTRKLYTAVVIDVHENKPSLYKSKEILAILEEDPIVNSIQLKFWKWISEYYISNIGAVMNVALPSSLKLASESKIIIHPDFDGDSTELNSNEINVLNNLSLKEELVLSEVEDILDTSSIFPLINELIRKEVVQIKEELHDKFRRKKLLFVELIEGDTNIYLEKVKSAKKQEQLLLFIIQLSKKFPKKKWTVSDVLAKSNISRAVLNGLVEKQILKIEKKEISRLITYNDKLEDLKLLSNKQYQAYLDIKTSFLDKEVCLLHGVTSSGKTEIYIKLIQDQLDKGKQVLYLLPEIALTTQIINRLKIYFGDKVGVSHSRMNNNERVEIWNAVKEKNSKKTQYPIIIGARSSLFLPFNKLGLIIVDEEHEPSFKQHQPSPRYHARDASIFLAHLHSAKVLLGSATPSLESYYNTQIDKYALVELNSRFDDIQLPEIHTVDIRKAYLKKKMQYHFSPFLLQSMKIALDNGKQIILFLKYNLTFQINSN